MLNPQFRLALKKQTPKQIIATLKNLYEKHKSFFIQNLLAHENSIEIIQYFLICNFGYLYTRKTEKQKPLLLRSICSISFPNLSILYLEKISISNFQAFEWLDAPNLKNLYLGSNDAIFLKPFAKTRFLLLKKFQIDENFHFHQLSHLTRMTFSSDSKIITQQNDQRAEQNSKQLPQFMMIKIFKMQDNCSFSSNLLRNKKKDILVTKLHQRNKTSN